MRLLRTIVLGLAVLVSPLGVAASVAAGPEMPIPANQGRVTDLSKVFTDVQRDSLATKLKALETTRADAPQVLLLTIPDIPDNDIETFAVKTFEAWKPGQKGIDNGLLIVIGTNARKVKIEVGYGLEPIITDSVAADIIKEKIGPHVKGKKREWYAGASDAIDAIGTRLEAGPPKPAQTSNGGGAIIAILLLFGLLGVFVLVLFLASRRRTAGVSTYTTNSYTPAPTYSGGSSYPTSSRRTRYEEEDDRPTSSALTDFITAAAAAAVSTQTTRRNTDNEWSAGGGRSGGGGASVDLSDDDDDDRGGGDDAPDSSPDTSSNDTSSTSDSSSSSSE